MSTRDKGEVVAVLLPNHAETKILVTRDGTEILHAVLGPPSQMHPQAAVRLLEGLALWFERTVHVVLCATDQCDGSYLSLADTFGVGTNRLHYDVEIVPLHNARRPALRMGHRGDFGDLRLVMRRALGAS